MGPYEMQCHGTLVRVAEKWLRKERHCRPVIVEMRSKGRYGKFSPEEPDAIGWRRRESIVVECKASLHDLARDKYKWRCLIHEFRSPITLKRMNPDVREVFERMGYEVGEVEKMGRFRYILCPKGLVTLVALNKHAPDHGLLYFDGKRIVVVKEAPQRIQVNLDAEEALRRNYAYRRRFPSKI